MQTKFFNNHHSMRLDVYADGDKKTFIRFGFSHSSIRLASQGNIGLQNAAIQMLGNGYVAFMEAKNTGMNYGERFAEIQKRCEAAKSFKEVAVIFSKVAA
jgi:hypothetical protein